MNAMSLICAINYWLVQEPKNIPYTVGNEVEIDEKYTPYNHKGTKIDGRGLSNQQVCIITAIQRFGHTIVRTLNYGKPSSVDLLRFGECLESKSFVMLDGSNSYNELLESKDCTKKVLISHESYDKFNHLNTVNSFHRLIEEKLQKYKGVASKYINRYNALFVMQRETQGMDNTEKLQYVLLRLKNI